MTTVRVLLESGDLLFQEDGASYVLTEASTEGAGEQFTHWRGGQPLVAFDTPVPQVTLLLESGDHVLLEDGSTIAGESSLEGLGEQFTHWRGGVPLVMLRVDNPSTTALTLAGLSVAATDAESFDTTAALTTAGLSSAATATEVFTATAALTTAGLSVAATDAESFDATAALTTAGLSAAATVAESFDATAALTLAGLSVAATDAEGYDTTVDCTMAGLSVDATAATTAPVTDTPVFFAGASTGYLAQKKPKPSKKPKVVRAEASLALAGLSCAASLELSYGASLDLGLPGLSASVGAEMFENPDESDLLLLAVL